MAKQQTLITQQIEHIALSYRFMAFSAKSINIRFVSIKNRFSFAIQYVSFVAAYCSVITRIR